MGDVLILFLHLVIIDDRLNGNGYSRRRRRENATQPYSSCALARHGVAAASAADRVGTATDSPAASYKRPRDTGFSSTCGTPHFRQLVRIRPKRICSWRAGPRPTCHDH